MCSSVHTRLFCLSHLGARLGAQGSANVCLSLRMTSRNTPAGSRTASPSLLLHVCNGPLKAVYGWTAGHPPPGLWLEKLGCQSSRSLPAWGWAVAQAPRMRSQQSFLFQDIKAFESQGPHAVEAGAPGTRVLCLRQRGQFWTEDIPSESHPLQLLQKCLPRRGDSRWAQASNSSADKLGTTEPHPMHRNWLTYTS